MASTPRPYLTWRVNAYLEATQSRWLDDDGGSDGGGAVLRGDAGLPDQPGDLGPAVMDKYYEWCAYPSCKAKTEMHHWASIKAHDEGWFFERGGPIWCPEHNPPWVAEWRARKART